MPRRIVGLWLTTAIWVAVGGGIWAYHDHQLRSGEEIVLKTVPVDPRDVLRGDYVVLRYEISSAERDDQDPFLRAGQAVYVALERQGGEWAIEDLTLVPPSDGPFLRATVRTATPGRLELVYGIESFFVPEGEGKRYEDARNRDRLWAVVRVSPHGVARLERLEIR